MIKNLFVIDTNTFVGNFERAMTAFITGQIGECGVGDSEQRMFYDDCPDMALEGLIDQLPDEHGVCRPCLAYPTPGWFNDGAGNHWPDEKWGSQEVLDAYRESAGSHSLGTPTKCSAYHSVAIVLYVQPTEDQTRFMVRRAREFETRYQDGSVGYGKGVPNFKISGFRMVEEKTVSTTTEIHVDL